MFPSRKYPGRARLKIVRVEPGTGEPTTGALATFVAEVSGVAVGLGRLARDDDEAAVGRIQELSIHPDHRRRGIGLLLCEKLLIEAYTWGFEEVIAWVASRDAPVRRFLWSQGFLHDGSVRQTQSGPELRLRRGSRVTEIRM